MKRYTALKEKCRRHDCDDNVWTQERNGRTYRIQTPYCERHAREFSDASAAAHQYRGS